MENCCGFPRHLATALYRQLGKVAMSPDADPRDAKKVEIGRWADTYTARLDQALTNAWPDLENRLRSAAKTLPGTN
jgi:hypothetical protein